ncbi:MAG: hypothetical protein IJ706_08995 [Clostridia bacterium]|nr:hypothetical protein [Clostridia bacterium]
MEYLLFNDALTMRFNTLICNIKAKSNSFYDAYLDLLEATIKYFLEEKAIEYDITRTCGFLVKDEGVKTFLLGQLKLDDYTYNKLPNYIKKCNDHKHKKEKTLGVDSIINYLKVYFDLINYYIDFIKGERMNFDADYFVSIYGETERLNKEYIEEVIRLKGELQESYDNNKLSKQSLEQFKSLVSLKDIEILNLDEQNKLLQAQINVLKDIKLSSMEEKLNKALDMLVNLNDEIQENRVATDAVYRSITGGDIKSAIKKIKGNE